MQLHQKVGMLALSMAAPRRLARLFLQPRPQRLDAELCAAVPAERIEFGSGGGALCRGWWVTPPAGSERTVILAHGWTSHALRMQSFLTPLLDEGYNVMLYHARGHGDSDPAQYISGAQFTEDGAAAVAYARTRTPGVALLGHSLGALAAIIAAADGAPVRALAVLAPPADPSRASREMLSALGVPGDVVMRRVRTHLEAMIGRTFESLSVERRIREVACPVLLVHGSRDQVVPVANFQAIRARGGENLETMLLDGGDHDSVKQSPAVHGRVIEFLRRTFPVC